MMCLDLYVFWLTGEQKELESAGIDVDLKDCSIKLHTFFNINFVREADNKRFCEIGCNDEVFIINESRDAVIQKIKNQSRFPWN